MFLSAAVPSGVPPAASDVPRCVPPAASDVPLGVPQYNDGVLAVDGM